MPSVRLTRVHFSFSDLVPLLVDVDLDLQSGFTALVGANGAGKTTLLKLIARELRPDSGAVRVEPDGARVVVCPQEVALADDSINELATRDDGEARALRDRLRLDPAMLARWETLSPGERKRWQIGGALARDPDVLLLDEPTNHVDAEANDLLLGALQGFAGVGVLVSHDRGLLDAIAHTIVRVDRGKVRAWPAPWASARAAWEREERAAVVVWEQARDAERARKRALGDLRRRHAEVERGRSTGARMRDKNDSDARGLFADFRAARAEQHVGRAVAVARDKLERARVAMPEKPPSELGSELFLGFTRPTQPVLAVLDQTIEVGGRPLLRDVRLTIRREDRVRIVGPNGAGKTTLLAAIVAAMRVPRVGVLPQELSPDEIVDAVREVRALDPEARGRVLSLLAALGVEPRRVLATERPSPGEARKLRLAMLLGTHLHALVLDEPTNHLDLPSIERLERALEQYPGALVIVTHDDAFAARCTETVLRVEDGAVR